MIEKGWYVWVRRFLLVVGVLLLVLSLYELVDGVYLYQTTGVLSVNSPGAFLTVEEGSTFFANIGTSRAKVRLKPGGYTLVASINKSQTIKSFTISAKRTTYINLVVKNNSRPAQPQTIVNSNAVIKYLPFFGPNFSYEVSYKYNITPNAALPVIIITSPSSSGTQAAENWLAAIGFPAASLNVELVNGTPAK